MYVCMNVCVIVYVFMFIIFKKAQQFYRFGDDNVCACVCMHACVCVCVCVCVCRPVAWLWTAMTVLLSYVSY